MDYKGDKEVACRSSQVKSRWIYLNYFTTTTKILAIIHYGVSASVPC